jgi:hypothetical protein
MDPASLMPQMESGACAIRALAEGLSEAQARWKPDPARWSILEVICHLHDEEREDFRVRLDLTLHDPKKDWPPINPQGWVTERRYQEQDLAENLEGFLTERQASLRWLRSLETPDWKRRHEHPRFGGMDAGELFAAWVAHDFLHIRQLAHLHHAYTAHLSDPFGTGYAGEWS